ncbi:hypothetical protein E6Q11_04040 [Candidatus Dojkabacteria bacterium]|uniref:Uncharacterized protein n=1 Tax=Candidatus Dojkabacteria bacterium TaxID=2099670 RepID=A0A5C7J8A0_9BACT|nr:MAG: hypothetical protein E6Q11_04040 [Candidatus Dojkabacteria bacterium]
MGGLSFVPYDGSRFTINGGGSFALPGVFGLLETTAASDTFDSDIYVGSILFRALEVQLRNSGQTKVIVNQPNIDIDFQVNYDLGTSFFVQGSDGQIQILDGSATTPALSFLNDSDTGIHYVGTNQFSLDAGGVSRVQVSSLETVVNPGKVASGDFKVHGDTVDSLIFTDASADTLSFGVGFTTPGDMEVTDSTKGVVLESPDGSRWRITVDDLGILTTTEI